MTISKVCIIKLTKLTKVLTKLTKISVTSLSGGVKTLILIKNESDKVFNATACGDNCAKWILQIAQQRDITINLRYLMDFGKEVFDIMARAPIFFKTILPHL